MSNCEKLGETARAIFTEITKKLPPLVEGVSRTQGEGIVLDDGRHDLRKGNDRDRWANHIRRRIGHTVYVDVTQLCDNKKLTLDQAALHPLSPEVRKDIAILRLLAALDRAISEQNHRTATNAQDTTAAPASKTSKQ